MKNIFKTFVFLLVFFIPSISYAAITHDADSSGSVTGTSLTVSHTVTGSDPLLQVCIVTGVNTDSVTGVTYNGDALTQFGVHETTGGSPAESAYGYYILNPDTGTHDIVVSAGSSIFMEAMSSSYTGVASSDDEASDNGTAITELYLTADALVADSSHIGCFFGTLRTASAGADTTAVNVDAGGGGVYISTTLVPAAPTTIGVEMSLSDRVLGMSAVYSPTDGGGGGGGSSTAASSTTVFNPNQDLFNGFTIFLMSMFGMIWLFRRRQ